MSKVYVVDPQKLADLAISGVILEYEHGGKEWLDVNCLIYESGAVSEQELHSLYVMDTGYGRRFFVTTE